MFPVLRLLLSAKKSVKYYTKGNENVPWVEGLAVTTGSVAKNADHLYMIAENAAARALRTYVTDGKIDLSSIRTLYFEWENSGLNNASTQSFVVVSTEKDGDVNTYNARKLVSGTFAKNIDLLDVSALKGSYYIRLHARDSSAVSPRQSELRVYRVWGEVAR
jgi:hypothetical protein